MVPFLDLRAAYEELEEELNEASRRVLSGGSYILGPECEAFEREFARFVGAAHAIGVGNGLDALTLALRALGVGSSDEVVVPANTYIATWLAVSAVGARPVPVEPCGDTFNLDPERLEAAITPRTRVVIPVHLYGHPADMDAILEIARRRGVRVLEDSAQAHGARYKVRRVGALGDVSAWSFYPGKNLGAAGDGGAVTTDDAEIARRIRELRSYGSTEKNVHAVRGTNSRLDELQAAILRVKLARLDEWNDRRRARAATYNAELRGSALELPRVAPWAEPVWHQFVVRSGRRDALRAHLDRSGIATMIHYPTPPHLQGAYRDLGVREGSLPVAERLHREVLSLPMGPHLGETQQREVIEAVRRFAT